MNLLEFITESNESDVYILIHKNTNKPVIFNGNEIKTNAISADKAFHQILYRIRTEGSNELIRIVVNNRDDFTVIPWYEYMTTKEIVSNVPPIKRREDPQMKLFPDPINPPH